MHFLPLPLTPNPIPEVFAQKRPAILRSQSSRGFDQSQRSCCQPSHAWRPSPHCCLDGETRVRHGFKLLACFGSSQVTGEQCVGPVLNVFCQSPARSFVCPEANMCCALTAKLNLCQIMNNCYTIPRCSKERFSRRMHTDVVSVQKDRCCKPYCSDHATSTPQQVF